MRILWLTPNLLLPLDKGGKLRTWHLMRHLERRHEITCVCFADPGQPIDHHRGMTAACTELVTIPRHEGTKEGLQFYASVARHLLSRLPYAVAQYRSDKFRAAVLDTLASGPYDRIVCDFLVPAVNLPSRLPCPAVLFTHNVEAEIWRRHAETATGWLRRRLYASQWRRMLRFERRTLSRFDRVLAVSDVDRDTFERLYPGSVAAPIAVIPTGVDTEYFAPPPETSGGTPHIVFTGSMDWLPNVDGVQFFCREILPRVRQAVPEATFSIVGRAPTPAVRRLAQEAGVEVTGRVEDVRPYLAQAAVYVVPLRIGGGTRLKIFEAMSAGRAVVSTRIGAEGLPVEDGRHLLLADDPPAFAHAVVKLLHDESARRALGQAARALVTERYDWAAAAERFEDALQHSWTPSEDSRRYLPNEIPREGLKAHKAHEGLT
jgi:polysaccharide biosynthesis protein PslH